MSAKAPTPLLVGIVLTIGWLLVLVVYLFSSKHSFSALWDLPANNFGDFLAGAFAPVAFLWLAIAVLLQRRELELQREELKLQRDELRSSTEALRLQAKELERAVAQYTRQSDSMESQSKAFALDLLLKVEEFYAQRLSLYVDHLLTSADLYGPSPARQQHWELYSSGNRRALARLLLNIFRRDNGARLRGALSTTLDAGGLRLANFLEVLDQYTKDFEQYRLAIAATGQVR